MTKPRTPSGKPEPVNMPTVPTTVGVLPCFWLLFEDYEAGTGIHTDDPTGLHLSWVINNSASIIPTILCQITFLPQPFQFPDLGQALSYIGLRTPRLVHCTFRAVS